MTKGSSVACVSPSTYRSKIFCSASRWSPRCCCCGSGNVRVGDAGPGELAAAFDAGAAAYDRLVGASPGYHAQLALSARRMRIPARGKGLRLLDAGCGTGASTAALLAVAPEADIVAVDASRGMLDAALAKC